MPLNIFDDSVLVNLTIFFGHWKHTRLQSALITSVVPDN